MLDMGFAEDIDEILSVQRRPSVRPCCSRPHCRRASTPSPSVTNVIPSASRSAAARPRPARPSSVSGRYVVARAHKAAALGRILDVEVPTAAIVFCRTRTEVDQLTETLNGRGYRAEPLHGGMSQEQRDRVMGRMRAGTAELLIATDVAARRPRPRSAHPRRQLRRALGPRGLRAPHRARRSCRPRRCRDHAGRAARTAPARQHRAADQAADHHREGPDGRRPARPADAADAGHAARGVADGRRRPVRSGGRCAGRRVRTARRGAGRGQAGTRSRWRRGRRSGDPRRGSPGRAIDAPTGPAGRVEPSAPNGAAATIPTSRPRPVASTSGSVTRPG